MDRYRCLDLTAALCSNWSDNDKISQHVRHPRSLKPILLLVDGVSCEGSQVDWIALLNDVEQEQANTNYLLLSIPNLFHFIK